MEEQTIVPHAATAAAALPSIKDQLQGFPGHIKDYVIACKEHPIFQAVPENQRYTDSVYVPLPTARSLLNSHETRIYAEMQGVEVDTKIVCDKYQVRYRLSSFAGIHASNFTVESLALVAAGHEQFWLGQIGMDVVTEMQRKHRLETDPQYSVRHDIEQVDIIQHKRVFECGVTLVACAVMNGGVPLEWSKAVFEDSRVYHYAYARDDTYPGPGIP
uniref:Uncharacterized protein n=1 Tax=Chromera velia CCMP2878 TaxID=1169474 RepID=A0A0G4H2K6_9ALVE|eukprot:Cvel_24443.t1-p1 / transcript=Cvel_24443.t1 / gene=Cvel_24443 / organism=Chromera_velia_CCMP2878 / gene_product=hypothetical protein / transcript_product=hypothetical protein / location=Cvel_scaffold2642:4875-5519(+) / protein_length=215 / sequence_SO=supercontig / SO=protein_coding / is_pseudo=false